LTTNIINRPRAGIQQLGKAKAFKDAFVLINFGEELIFWLEIQLLKALFLDRDIILECII
jgi:hypothetical protein